MPNTSRRTNPLFRLEAGWTGPLRKGSSAGTVPVSPKTRQGSGGWGWSETEVAEEGRSGTIPSEAERGEILRKNTDESERYRCVSRVGSRWWVVGGVDGGGRRRKTHETSRRTCKAKKWSIAATRGSQKRKSCGECKKETCRTETRHTVPTASHDQSTGCSVHVEWKTRCS